MLRPTILHVLAIAPLLSMALSSTARADQAPRVSGPHTHENLSIYFIHGKSAEGPVPLTLDEALAKNLVDVHETGTVSQLLVENKGEEEVFVHAGDIVKGGKQDRVVTASFVLPAKSKPTEVPVYCVEAGRWAARGNEDVKRFVAAAEMLPTKEAKLAMMAAPTATASLAQSNVDATRRGDAVAPEAHQHRDVRPLNIDPAQRIQRSSNSTDSLTERGPAGGQGELWRNVDEIQKKLSAKLSAKVSAAESESSLQLALENDKLVERQNGFVKALLKAAGANDDIVGYAIAVNGRIASADVYASNALFKKLWPRLLKTAATEAISAPEAKSWPAPAIGDVVTFLATEETKPDTTTPVAGVSVTARAAEASYDAETTRAGKFLHRSKLAR